MTGRLRVSVLYQGALIAGFGFIGNLWLIQRYLPSQVSLLSLTQPIFAVILARIVLGEALSSTLWLSVALVVVGASLVQRNGIRLRMPGNRR